MALDELIAVLPPPLQQREPGSVRQWEDVQRRSGIIFPSDYKDYIGTYGTGVVGAYIYPYNPFAAVTGINLLDQWPRMVDLYRHYRDKIGPRACPYPLYPEPGGLLPWAFTDQEDMLFWRTGDAPESWTVVVAQEAGEGQFQDYEETMTSFLAKWIAGEIVCDLFAEWAQHTEAEYRLFRPYG